MNKIIAILPNSLESKRDFKDLRKDIINNYRVENIISLPEYTFQPHATVNTIILNLSTEKPQDHFWKFKVKNDGYTQNRRREKKEGENDWDIFWQFKDHNENEKLKRGFQKLEIAKIKQQKDWEFNLPPDFSYLWRKPTSEELAIREKEQKDLDLQFLDNWKQLKAGMEKRAEEIKKRWNINE